MNIYNDAILKCLYVANVFFISIFFTEIRKFKDPSYKKPREFRVAFQYLLPVLKIYSTRLQFYVYYRFSVLAVNIEMQPRSETQNSKFKMTNLI